MRSISPSGLAEELSSERARSATRSSRTRCWRSSIRRMSLTRCVRLRPRWQRPVRRRLKRRAISTDRTTSWRGVSRPGLFSTLRPRDCKPRRRGSTTQLPNSISRKTGWASPSSRPTFRERSLPVWPSPDRWSRPGSQSSPWPGRTGATLCSTFRPRCSALRLPTRRSRSRSPTIPLSPPRRASGPFRRRPIRLRARFR